MPTTMLPSSPIAPARSPLLSRTSCCVTVMGAPTAGPRCPTRVGRADGAFEHLPMGGRAAAPVGREPPSAQSGAVVQLQPGIGLGTLGHDPGGIHVRVHDVVVLLDLLEVDRLAEAGGLVEVAGVA